MSHARDFDYEVVNDDLDEAVDTIVTLIEDFISNQ